MRAGVQDGGREYTREGREEYTREGEMEYRRDYRRGRGVVVRASREPLKGLCCSTLA